jgi:Asp-tRNA(Asn)/Glu-tRNA(Gln) amidotransferase A subunit family amidase
VAAGHVPVAVGTQTNGSVIRPASFCGVYAVKPSFGMISRNGVLRTSQTFDQVGVFANALEDAALITDILADFDPLDKGCFWRPRPKLSAGLLSPRLKDPYFAWFDMPYFDHLSSETHAGLMDIVARLGNRVEQVKAPISFAELIDAHAVIQTFEIPRNLDLIRQNYGDIFPSELTKLLANGDKISEKAYKEALQCRSAAIDYFASFFEKFDAVLTPAALGEAPLFSESTTGHPICSTVWTLAGLPCITLPMMTSTLRMPIGVQLVGNAETDDNLCGVAKWLDGFLNRQK